MRLAGKHVSENGGEVTSRLVKDLYNMDESFPVESFEKYFGYRVLGTEGGRVHAELGFLKGTGLRLSFPQKKAPLQKVFCEMEIDSEFERLVKRPKTQQFLRKHDQRRRGMSAEEAKAQHTPGGSWTSFGGTTHIWVDFDYYFGVKNLFAPHSYVYRYADLLLQLDPA